MTMRKINPPISRPLLRPDEVSIAANSIMEACLIRNWLHGISAHRKFVLEQFIRYMEQRLQETEDALFVDIRQ